MERTSTSSSPIPPSRSSRRASARARLLLAAAAAALLAGAGCGDDEQPIGGGADAALPGPDAPVGPDCTPGLDTDGDGVPNDLECTLGTDPESRDTDGDGATDREELAYPEGCIADDPAAQRRPPPPCAEDTDCEAGERCRGSDPLDSDSDDDGIPDGLEDEGMDGVLDPSVGESDPRLSDTNGDGVSDGVALEICSPQGLAVVTQVALPGRPVQVGHDPAFGTAVTLAGLTGSAVLLDDPATGVSGAVFGRPSAGDLSAERLAIEPAIASAMGAGVTPVLVGRAITTHEGHPGATSIFRVARTTTASALRDSTISTLVGATAPAGPAVGAASEFTLLVTIVVRATGEAAGGTDVILAVAPTADYQDATKATSIRVNDLVNATAIAEGSRVLGAACGVFTSEGASMADFLWAVDTSGSMNDDQDRLGNTAHRFFEHLTAANVDFRVGVINAGYSALDLDTPGFQFIDGLDPAGADRLCQEVTVDSCPVTGAETLRPYPMSGSETPTATSVILHQELRDREAAGETNPDRRLRAGALPVAFFVTDEPGSNDWSRYFQSSTDPQSGVPWGASYGAASLASIVDYFTRNGILTFGLVPVRATACAALDVYDLPRCVIEGNGGAAIPIATAAQTEIDAAMDAIVTAVAGASSQYSLRKVPITSTLRVVVRGNPIPRSRHDGFDYDGPSQSVIFYGRTYRPEEGDQVVVSYRTWEDASTIE